jgi:flagellar P-ring protein precursor FlgI
LITLVCLLAFGLVSVANAQTFEQLPEPLLQQLPQELPQPNRIDEPVPAQRLPQLRVPESTEPGMNRFGDRTPQVNSAYLADSSARIKDITTIEGHRTNVLEGVGMVIGLKGTGGKSQTTRDAAKNLLQNFDVLTSQAPTGNTSLVMVTAEIPAFARPGEKIAATVSVLDDATGLYGGRLVSTPLSGYDGEVYAMASGNLTVGGFSAAGAASSVSKNHDTAATVDAIIELEIQQGPAFPGDAFRLLLRNKDYATAHRIATEINLSFPGSARAINQGSVEVNFPHAYRNAKIDFVVRVNEMRVIPDHPASVVINQKTGTIVIGQNVRLSRLLVAHGNLIITTNETPVASQPAPFSDGQTVVLPRTQVTATEIGSRYNVINPQTTVGDLAAALNTLGVSPQDLIAIFRDLEAQGALQAELIVK